MFPALDIIDSRPPRPAHTEFAGTGSRLLPLGWIKNKNKIRREGFPTIKVRWLLSDIWKHGIRWGRVSTLG